MSGRLDNMKDLVLFCAIVYVSIPFVVGEPVSVCPGGRRPVRCFISPCDLPKWKTCHSNPSLECRANYCHGCEQVDYYDVTGVKVICKEGPEIQEIQKDQPKPAVVFKAHNLWPFSDLYTRIKSLLSFKKLT
ncbi:uncharacterized protein [Argopecten irradians]|uniref:uncharacterized protein n=1 Tax=Argopecten irradians TaxID=31199 RepID=UPI00371C655F